MPTFKVKVKWGKEMFDVDVDTDEEPLLFKAQLYELTGVQTDRQKVMSKGITLRNDEWDKFKVSNGSLILLMGSKEEDSMKEPSVKVKFVEDMNESEKAVSLDLPAGLNNLGNTCYMNAVIQCLKTVPELRKSLKSHTAVVSLQPGSNPAESIAASLRDLYDCMDNLKVSPSISPFIMLQVLHNVFPRFADKTDDGSYMQQDANECWTELVRMLKTALPAKKSIDGQENTKTSFIEQYFYTIMDTELKCSETEAEPATKGTESFQQLSCYITTDVKYMLSGLKNKLQEQITKRSSTLDRDAIYVKTSKVCRLPAYLTVQFVRFYYKEKERINAKVLKDIKFPIEFDAYELCTPELQAKLAPMREKFKVAEEKQAFEVKKDEKQKLAESCDSGDKKEVDTFPVSFDDDVGSNNSGYYTLQAVLTHKGRTSSSGHYVAWVRKPHSDAWIKCDDDTVYPISQEEVLKLSGGGDWHCAYLLLYGPKKLEKSAAEPMATSP